MMRKQMERTINRKRRMRSTVIYRQMMSPDMKEMLQIVEVYLMKILMKIVN
jgi:hypothetical protein